MNFSLPNQPSKRARGQMRALGLCVFAGMIYGWIAGFLFCVLLSMYLVGTNRVAITDFFYVCLEMCIALPILYGIPSGALAGLLAGLFRRMTFVWLAIGLLAGAVTSIMCYFPFMGIYGILAEPPVPSVPIALSAVPILLSGGIMAALMVDYRGRHRLPFVAKLCELESEIL